MTPAIEMVAATDHERWMAILSQVAQYDFYHLPQYHEMAEQAGEGRAHLFVYTQGEHVIALPLLIRPCDSVEGLEGVASLDATSVYGYAGPVSSDHNPAAPVIAGFQSSLREALQALQVVALFTRLHPLLPQLPLIAGLGEITPSGTTVSVDLTQSEEAQTAGLRLNHVRDIRKLRALGATCAYDASNSLDGFVGMYRETMRRVGAAPHYFFDDAYFAHLGDLRGSYVHLFSCVLNDEVIAAGLFFACGNIVQYHLGAVRTGHTALGPMKLILDTARAWASQQGMRIFHLGGGLAAQEDALFHFKAGFSHRRHPYMTWRWILDQTRYDAISAAKENWNADHGVRVASDHHFPRYRGLTAPVQPEATTPVELAVPDSGNDRRTHDRPAPEVSQRPRPTAQGKVTGPPNVLLTAAGRRTTLVRAFADEVRTRGGRTYAGDVDPLAPALFLADEAIRLGATNDHDYVANLVEIVRRHNIRLLVPTIDPDLPVIAHHQVALRSIGCIAAVSSESFVALARDKYIMFTTLSAHGVDLAASWLPGEERSGLPDRLFVKPRRGSGSVSTHDVARSDLDRILPMVDDPILQEVLDGPEITIDALLDLDARPIHFVPRSRIRTLAGESIQGVTLEHDPDLEAWIVHLLEVCSSLGAAGPLCLQAFLTERGPVLSEINARFGGGFPLGLAAGGDYARWLLDMTDGIRVPSRLGMYEAGLYMTRYHVEHFTRSPKW